MDRTNAQRQADYRRRHLQDPDSRTPPVERLNTVVSLKAKRTLERLASCYGVTQKTILEKILARIERELLEQPQLRGLDNDYYDQRLRIDSTVTQ